MAIVLICHGSFELLDARVKVPPGITLKTLVGSGQSLPTAVLRKRLTKSPLTSSDGVEFKKGQNALFPNLSLSPITPKQAKAFMVAAEKGGHRVAFLNSDDRMCNTPDDCNLWGRHQCGGVMQKLAGLAKKHNEEEVYLAACLAVAGEPEADAGSYQARPNSDPAVTKWNETWGDLHSSAVAILASATPGTLLKNLTTFARRWNRLHSHYDMTKAYISQEIGDAETIWRNIDGITAISDSYHSFVEMNDEEDGLQTFQQAFVPPEVSDIIETHESLSFIFEQFAFMRWAARFSHLEGFKDFLKAWDGWKEEAESWGFAEEAFDGYWLGRIPYLLRMHGRTQELLQSPEAFKRFDEYVGFMSADDALMYLYYLEENINTLCIAPEVLKPCIVTEIALRSSSSDPE